MISKEQIEELLGLGKPRFKDEVKLIQEAVLIQLVKGSKGEGQKLIDFFKDEIESWEHPDGFRKRSLEKALARAEETMPKDMPENIKVLFRKIVKDLKEKS